MRIITDEEIRNYLTEKKILERGSKNPPKLFKNARDLRKTQKIIGLSETEYLITIRKAIDNDNNFCIIFSLKLENNNQFILIRYNGNWHRHRNVLEKNILTGFHIHTTTERYQKAGLKREGYAEGTNRYKDWESGYKRMLRDLNIIKEEDRNQKNITDKY